MERQFGQFVEMKDDHRNEDDVLRAGRAKTMDDD